MDEPPRGGNVLESETVAKGASAQRDLSDDEVNGRNPDKGRERRGTSGHEPQSPDGKKHRPRDHRARWVSVHELSDDSINEEGNDDESGEFAADSVVRKLSFRDEMEHELDRGNKASDAKSPNSGELERELVPIPAPRNEPGSGHSSHAITSKVLRRRSVDDTHRGRHALSFVALEDAKRWSWFWGVLIVWLLTFSSFLAREGYNFAVELRTTGMAGLKRPSGPAWTESCVIPDWGTLDRARALVRRDKDGHPILDPSRAFCRPQSQFEQRLEAAKLEDLVKDMRFEATKEGWFGLAGVHMGSHVRIVVLKDGGAMLNPRLQAGSGTTICKEEDAMEPGVTRIVPRNAQVTVGFDTMIGGVGLSEFEGKAACAVQRLVDATLGR